MKIAFVPVACPQIDAIPPDWADPTTPTIGPYATSAACEAARAAATAATCGPITGPDAACVAYCKSGWYPGGCIAKATNALFTVAAACFPQQSDNQYYFSCTNTATCHCV